MLVDIDARDMSGKTALHTAILYKQKRSVDLLLQAGALVSIADESGDTPMHTAIRVGSLEIVEVSGEEAEQTSVLNVCWWG